MADDATNHAGRILVAEDDADMRAVIVEALRRDGFVVDDVGDALALRARILGAPPRAFDLVVSDVRLPGGSALSVLEDPEVGPRAGRILFITAFSDDDVRARAAGLGAELLDKPFAPRALRERVGALFRGR